MLVTFTRESRRGAITEFYSISPLLGRVRLTSFRNMNKWNKPCFGIHCFAISKNLLEIKYPDVCSI